MIVSNCPRCGEAIRVPAGELPDDAYAQCPWCRETFPASDVAKALPPVLELLSADGQPIVPARNQAAAIGVVGDSDPSSSPDVTAESFDFGETASEDPDSTWASEQPSLARDDFAPMDVSPGRARRSKGGGGITKVIGVVLGGVLAVPLAGGILMALGRTPDLGFWPFNGPGESSRSTVAAPPVDLSHRRDPNQNQPAGRLLSPDLDSETLSVAPAELAREQIMAEPKIDDVALNPEADPPISDPPASQPPPVDSRTTDDSPMVLPKANELAVDEPNPTDMTEEDLAASADPPSNAPRLEMPSEVTDREPDLQSTESTASAPIAEAQTDRPESEIESVPTDDSPKLVKMADRAGKMVEAVSAFEGDPKERDRRMLLTYEEIAGACDIATRDSKALSALASKIKDSPLLEELGGAGPAWLAYSSRKSEGILLVGKTDTGEGKTIQLDSGKVVSLVGNLQTQGAERVLAMGRIIDENSIELLLAQPLP